MTCFSYRLGPKSFWCLKGVYQAKTVHREVFMDLSESQVTNNLHTKNKKYRTTSESAVSWMNDNIILFIQTQQYYITSSSSTVPGSNVSRPQQSHPVLSSNKFTMTGLGWVWRKWKISMELVLYTIETAISFLWTRCAFPILTYFLFTFLLKKFSQCSLSSLVLHAMT